MERTYTMDELWSALKRRWKTAAIVAGGVLVIAAVVIARIPSHYTARALVMAEEQRPHPDLITPVISTTLEERVKSVRAQVYARSVMAAAVQELKLYPDVVEKNGVDAGVDLLRLDTEVHPEGDQAFSIAVRSRDPQVAAKAANRLAELYVEGNLQVRAGQAQRIRQIVSDKLTELRNELDQADAKIAQFKREHADTLPELVEARMRERDQLTRQIEQELTFMQAAQTRIDLFGTQPFGKDTEVGRLEDEEQAVAAQRTAAAAQLTPDHPDVQNLGRQLGEIRGRLAAARARADKNDLERRRMEDAIKRGRSNVERIEARIASIDKIIAQGPLVASQLATVSRDADLLRAKVTQLVGKRAEADLAADLEAKASASEYRVLESAMPPSLPAGPDRMQALLLAMAVALALGSAVAVAQELSDRSLRSSQEASAWTSLPVLATVPTLPAVALSSGRALLPERSGTRV